ncbi:MAG: hypothetical protein BWX83_00489 [Candidatus Cloacimonetes bacterium ADurb.Bin117]|nr:MAG: hypothetical protein BWX83_00489 [Candidatus Cloacimonetes bacterium ADurb.Bin117]
MLDPERAWGLYSALTQAQQGLNYSEHSAVADGMDQAGKSVFRGLFGQGKDLFLAVAQDAAIAF